MKRLLLIFIALLTVIITSYSQTPQAFKYQAIVRDSEGDFLPNQNVGLRISILQSSSSGTAVFIETYEVTSNGYGLVNLEIGTGTLVSGNFSTIDWGADDYFLQIELDVTGGSNYEDIGATQLLSVPYALYAANTGNTDDADPDPENEIQTLSQTGNSVTLSNGGGTINNDDDDADPANEIQTISRTGDIITLTDGGTVNVTDDDADPANEMQTISRTGDIITLTDGGTVNVTDDDADPDNELQTLSLADDRLTLSNGNYVDLPYDASFWTANGENIYYDNGKVGIGTTAPNGKFEIFGDPEGVDIPLFEVKDHEGNSVFAVYKDGVRIIVPEGTNKPNVGGFAVSGRSSINKTITEYLRITPDSVRIYVDENSKERPNVGGFAVSGRSSINKTDVISNYLHITPDSVRIYVDESNTGKPNVGGFAVSGRSSIGKKITNQYLRVTSDSTRIFVNDSTAGFGISSIQGGPSHSLLNLTTQNYFIGHRSGDSITTGRHNAFFGYKSGISTTEGEMNLFLGHKTGYLNKIGNRNIFLGLQSGYNNYNGHRNIFIGFQSGYSNIGGDDFLGSYNSFMGYQSGYSNTTGSFNSFIGYWTGFYNSTGWYNSFFGNLAGAGNISGEANTYIGHMCGFSNQTGSFNTCLGNLSGYSNMGEGNVYIGRRAGFANVDGNNNVFIGFEAGKYELGTNKLYIANGELAENTLIYGEFDNNILYLNADVSIGSEPPLAPLDILTNSDGYAIRLEENTGNTEVWQIGVDNNGDLNFFDGTSSQISFLDGGFIGVGTSSPTSSLYIQEKTAMGSPSTVPGLIIKDGASNTANHIEVKNSSGTNLFVITDNGNVGIGTSPGRKLDVSSTNAVAARFNRGNDGSLIQFQSAGNTEGSISINGSTTSYNAFTGSHYAHTDSEIEKGYLVCLTGENKFLNNNTESEIIYGIAISQKANSSSILGAYLGEEDFAGENSPHLVMAVGNGVMWVVENEGNLIIGDYLISSNVAGHAMKDLGNFEAANIVARVAEPIDWKNVTTEINGVKHKLVSVFYESFVLKHNDKKLEALQSENMKVMKELETIKAEIEKISSLQSQLDELRSLLKRSAEK
jgi:hypothetical protein